MKTAHLTTLFVFALFFAAYGEKDIRPRFERMRPIEGVFSLGQRGKLVVTDDLFGQCRNYPNDIRLFGADGTQWPFFVHVPRQTTETGRLTPEIRNRSFVEGSEPYLQFDLLIPETNGKAPVHNRLELTTSGRDYVRRVEVFSGEPAGRMAAGYLIDFSAQRNARNRMIRYPASDAKRLSVRIYSNARSVDETFRLSSAQLHFRTVTEVERETVAAVQLDIPAREQEKGAQTFLFDLGETGRPVEFARLKVGTASYARSVCIYGRNTDRDPWKWVGGGAIHKLDDDQQEEIELHAKHRFIKLQVFHYDDQPLAIEALELQAVPRYLVFEAASAGEGAVCFRAWEMKPPRYDLKGRLQAEAIRDLPQVHTLNAVTNETAKTQSWRKYAGLLGMVAVGAVSLMVVGIIVSMLRQQKSI